MGQTHALPYSSYSISDRFTVVVEEAGVAPLLGLDGGDLNVKQLTKLSRMAFLVFDEVFLLFFIPFRFLLRMLPICCLFLCCLFRCLHDQTRILIPFHTFVNTFRQEKVVQSALPKSTR
jgi:hypothetical protein